MFRLKFILSLCVLCVIGCQLTPNVAKHKLPAPLSKLEPFRKCQIDSDCVFANNGCCDCANGGQEVAINRSKINEFRALFDCEGVACTEVARIPPCGTGTVSCNQGLCVFVLADGETP